MKKNKLMRLASVLLILCLLTTSVISGTFAKYVTSDSGFDVARVAKFGVVASVSGDLFGETYDAVGSENKIISYDEDGGTVSASSTSRSNVVAPGTVGGTMTFSITGTPEVSTTINLGLPLDKAGAATSFVDTDIKLIAGTYGVMKPVNNVTLTDENKGDYWKYSDETKKFTQNNSTTGTVYELVNYVEVGDDYLPIKWTVGSTTGIADVATARTNLENALYGTGEARKTDFAPNADLTKSATLTWTWAFTDGSSTVISEQDKMDTILGDLIAIAGGTISNSYVVVKDASGSDYTALNVASDTKDASSDGSVPAQTIYFAKKATSTATAWNASDNVAVLTESFGASLTVTQVD